MDDVRLPILLWCLASNIINIVPIILFECTGQFIVCIINLTPMKQSVIKIMKKFSV